MLDLGTNSKNLGIWLSWIVISLLAQRELVKILEDGLGLCDSVKSGSKPQDIIYIMVSVEREVNRGWITKVYR